MLKVDVELSTFKIALYSEKTINISTPSIDILFKQLCDAVTWADGTGFIHNDSVKK